MTTTASTIQLPIIRHGWLAANRPSRYSWFDIVISFSHADWCIVTIWSGGRIGLMVARDRPNGHRVVVLSADPPMRTLPYAVVVSSAVRSFLDEPRVADPPARDWRDWTLFGAVVVTAIIEAALRPDVVWRWTSLVMCLGVASTLLWRRQRPLEMTTIAFGTTVVVSLAAAIGPGE